MFQFKESCLNVHSLKCMTKIHIPWTVLKVYVVFMTDYSKEYIALVMFTNLTHIIHKHESCPNVDVIVCNNKVRVVLCIEYNMYTKLVKCNWCYVSVSIQSSKHSTLRCVHIESIMRQIHTHRYTMFLVCVYIRYV